ncbi:phage holin [Bifidobacterium cuniculi]|uniref:Holin, SPP1 family n=1 Tax=Bifidobacterium cuniculi TaxID=1688 RepID=A0A087B4D1_9BIFI|nr:phage holin [Bifidobacterium cuniculi]KFI65881.1 holin, SPP1 family [Bifidobacterium cuniculi]
MADHATPTTNTGIGKERAKAIATLAVSLYSMISAGCALAGINPLPFTTDQVSAGVFSILSVISVIYAWWKDQNITEAAAAGSVVTRSIKLSQSSGNAADMQAATMDDLVAPEDEVVAVEENPMTPVDDDDETPEA